MECSASENDKRLCLAVSAHTTERTIPIHKVFWNTHTHTQTQSLISFFFFFLYTHNHHSRPQHHCGWSQRATEIFFKTQQMKFFHFQPCHISGKLFSVRWGVSETTSELPGENFCWQKYFVRVKVHRCVLPEVQVCITAVNMKEICKLCRW